MGRQLDTDGIKELLQGNLTHPRWDEVAERCLTCGNCTMVCPTCFCTTVEDHSDLTGTSAERVRKWDSCFTMDFSYHPWRQRAHIRQFALPAMDDAQARELDRPVRHFRLRRLRALHHLVSGGHRHHRRGGRHPRQTAPREEASHMEGLERILVSSLSLPGSAERCAAHRRLRAQPSASRPGSISSAKAKPAEQVLPGPPRPAWRSKSCHPGERRLSSLHSCAGDIVGASWLIPPYRWTIDARATEPSLALGIDAACLRGKCEADHHLGYEMMKRFLPVLVNRLHADAAANPRCLWQTLSARRYCRLILLFHVSIVWRARAGNFPIP